MTTRRSLALGLAPALAASLAYGQVASRVSGTIRDTTDAVMQGAAVTLEEINKGTAETTISNEAGRYSFPTVKVGSYRLLAEAKGFKKATTETFQVNVNQTVEMDFRMEVGQVAESIEVSALAAMLQTSDSQVGNLIETRNVVDLPLAARDFMQLSLISPGVSDSTGNQRHQTERASWVGSFSVHGHDPTYNQYLFDGVAGKEASHQTNIFAPSVDAIQEIKIETSNYSAEFGSEAGGHINVVTRSGTNRIHGALYEFLRNDKMDARDSFADRKSKLRRNTFGGTVGGPVFKDKTFYFFSWESMRLRQGFTQNTTVPDANMRSGDFSALLGTDSSLRTPIVLYDWTTGLPFANNIIPKTRQQSLPVKFINEFVPLPNRVGRGTLLPLDNYQSLEPQRTGNDQFVGRIDHTFGSKDRVYGRYIISDIGTLGPPVWPAFSYHQDMRGQQPMANWSHTFSPRIINDFRAGYSRFYERETTESAYKRNVAAELGLKGACNQPSCYHAPYFAVQDFDTMGNPSGKTLGQGVSGPRAWKSELFQIHNSLLIVKSNHTMRVGFTGNRYRDTFPEAIRPAGNHIFNGQWTAGLNSRGFALADALMGLPREILASIDIFDPNFRNSHVMPWIQDDWKITRKLTLNLGLRYEWMGRMAANRDTISNFYQTGPNTAVIITPQATTSPVAQKRPEGLSRALVNNDNNNFAPRFGFAYQVSPKWVARGAYGIFYRRYSAQDAIGMSINPPFIRTGDVVLGVRQQDAATYPIDDLTPVVNFVAPGSRPAVNAIDVNAKDGYVQQWNFHLERSLTERMVVKAGYVGTKSTGLDEFRSPNVPQPGPGDVQSRRPFPNLSSIRLSKSEGFVTYHGMELSAQQRLSKGVNFTTGYTWARTIDNGGLGGSTLNPYNTVNDKGLSNFHRAHRFFLAGVWEIPYGRGRVFGSNVTRMVDTFLGGWQLSNFLFFETGNPVTVTTLGDNLNTGGGFTQVPYRLAEPTLPRGQRTRTRYFNTDVFVRPPLYQLGNSGRNILIGPGSRNLDLSFAKQFQLTESKSLQLRAELFNATNHPNWGNPGTTLGSSSFGIVTSNSNLPRQVQIGLKLRY
ncbi:MAG: TonB-dependent receptor [Acidobacteria bacterium]|nr:TonB-dependent receptor [Acidobacteriota bacterium]